MLLIAASNGLRRVEKGWRKFPKTLDKSFKITILGKKRPDSNYWVKHDIFKNKPQINFQQDADKH